MYYLKNEKGITLPYALIVFMLTTVLGILIASHLKLAGILAHESNKAATLSVAKSYTVDSVTNIALGDNIYRITPEEILEEQNYDIVDKLYFAERSVTVTMNTKYSYINYAILNGNKVIDYKIDPKTEIIGIAFSELAEPIDSVVTVPDYEYPSISQLIPYTVEHSKHRLSFDVKDGKYRLKFPLKYNTANDITESSATTTFTIPFPDKFTDILIFYSDKLHISPIVIDDLDSELIYAMITTPYIRLSYDDEKKTILFSSNLVSVTGTSLNETLSYTGPLIEITMYDDVSHDIVCDGYVLNYPEQNKIKYQLNQTSHLTTWHYSTEPYSILFTNSFPKEITITRTGYMYTILRNNIVTERN